MENAEVSSYVPGSKLLPQVPRLRYQYCADLFGDLATLNTKLDEMRRVTVPLENLPYCLGAASLAMSDLAREQAAIVAAKATIEKPGTTSELSEPHRSILGFRLDSFLEAARRAQNGIIPYLSRAFRRSLPDSLEDLVKGLEAGKHSLPDPFKSDILEYWMTLGAKLRRYRVLSQHYLIVGTAAKVILPKEGEPLLLFCMPNNPEAKQGELRYDAPQVHVQHFVLQQFFGLLEFSYGILEALIDRNTNCALQPVLEGNTPLTRVGSGQGTEAYAPVPPDDVENLVIKALEELRARHDHQVARPA